MNYLEIAETDFSPLVKLSNDYLVVEGEIRPEFPHEFFGPIHQKLSELTTEKLVVKCTITFISSSSILQLKKLFKEILSNKGIKNVSVDWHYQNEDEDMLEVGEYLEELSSLKFTYFKV